jgi:hypothetical protein
MDFDDWYQNAFENIGYTKAEELFNSLRPKYSARMTDVSSLYALLKDAYELGCEHTLEEYGDGPSQ